MLKNLPLKVIEYLVDKIPPYSGLLMIKVDDKGTIINWKGEPADYLENKLTKGNNIEENIPALNGMIPCSSSVIKLSKIQLRNKYTDIHIIKENGNCWIILIDQTKEVENLRELLQHMNEHELNENRIESTDNSINPFLNFYKLNFATFRRNSDGSFSLLPVVPDWIKSHKLYNKETNTIDPVHSFPFLEVFTFEVANFWKEQQNNYIVSETWSETIGNKDHFLRAYAANFKNDNYLFIKSFIREGVEEQKLLQAFRDSTLAFDKLEKAEKKLKILLSYKNKFNSIISHDLRSPIAAVLGVINVLTSDKEELYKLNPDYQELILGIKDEMLRLLDYNDKLYHWANLELGNFKLEIEEVTLSEIIEIAANTAKTKCQEKNISLKINIKNGSKVKLDKTLFLQVLNNLLSNAVKFTPENREIIISEKQEKEKVIIAVKDTGLGMDEETAQNLFDETLHKTTLGTSGEKGTGLGLGIIKKILDAHNFNIRVESELGKGTEFFIEIPRSAIV